METELTQEVLEQEPLAPTGEGESPAVDEVAAEPAESAPAEEPTAEVKTAAPADELPEKVQKRIDEVTWQKYEAQRERDYWKMQAEARLKAEQQAPPEPAPVIPAQPPRQEDFETYEAYDEALFDWRFQQRVQKEATERQRQVKQQQEQEYAAKLDAWTEEGSGKYPDFVHVVLKQPVDGGPNITPFMAGAIQDSPAGHDVAYFLGKHPKEALRISKLSPVAQVREIGALQFKVQTPEQKTTTSAPSPTSPVGGKEAPSVKPEDMTYEQYRAYRTEQLKAARK